MLGSIFTTALTGTRVIVPIKRVGIRPTGGTDLRSVVTAAAAAALVLVPTHVGAARPDRPGLPFVPYGGRSLRA